MVPDDRSYQKQYLAKIFPSLVTSTLHIYFYFHLKEPSENALWIAIAFKSATFSTPESAAETALETMLFIQNLTKKFGEKAYDRVCFDRIDQFCTHFLFPACYFFCYWENFPSHAWLARNCVYEAALFFFPGNTSNCFCLLKVFIIK